MSLCIISPRSPLKLVIQIAKIPTREQIFQWSPDRALRFSQPPHPIGFGSANAQEIHISELAVALDKFKTCGHGCCLAGREVHRSYYLAVGNFHFASFIHDKNPLVEAKTK